MIQTRKFLVPFLCLLLTGCVSIPTAEFEEYKKSFAAAKTSTENLMLEARAAADIIADSPHSQASAGERRTQLSERYAAVDARLAALDLISKYNDTLVSLASGSDPKVVQAQVEGFRDSLSAFQFAKLADLGSKMTPYTAVIAEGIRIVDDLIKKQKFKEAVYAGQKPIIAILQVLQEDADSLQKIQSQLVLLKRDGELAHVKKLQLRIKNLAGTYQASPELNAAISRYNTTMPKLRESKLSADSITAPAGATAAKLGEIEVVQSLIDLAAERIEAANRYTDSVAARKKVTEEYKKLIVQTIGALQNLESAIKTNQQAALLSFAEQVLNFRQSIIQLQTANSL